MRVRRMRACKSTDSLQKDCGRQIYVDEAVLEEEEEDEEDEED